MPTHEGLHEDPQAIRPDTAERHRAIASLGEELEAIDWYDQRIDATADPDLRGILAHNRDEEKEHAAMLLEWLRRRDGALDAALHRYLFTNGNLLAIEDAEAGKDAAGAAAPGDGSLGIGDLRARASVAR